MSGNNGDNHCACGARISFGHTMCLACSQMKQVQEQKQREHDEMRKAVTEESIALGTTHIIMAFRSQSREDLYRADGMLLASRQGEVVRFGMEPKEAGTRLFLNADFASAWLHKLAGMEMLTRKGTLSLSDAVEKEIQAEVFIEYRDAEKLIVMPTGGPVQVLRH